MTDNRPRLAWLADGDELHQAAGVWWLWRSVLCGAFVVAGVVSLLLHDRTSALVWLLFAVVVKPG